LVLLIFVVLVASDGGADMEGKLLIDYLVHCVRKGRISVQEGELDRCDWGAVVVDGHGKQDLSVDGVTATIRSGDLGLVILDVIGDKGGDDEAVGDGIGDQDPVILFGEQIIYLPSGPRVVTAYPT
jgi:hypothetical protein